MKKLSSWILAILFAGGPSAHAALTLEDSFQAAIKRSEDLANQGELVNQAEEHYQQAIGSVFPTINFVGTYLKQDHGSSNASLSPEDQKTYKIAATQPLFRGFREYAALKLTKLQTQAQEYQREAVYLQLFQDTATAYYNVLANEKDLVNIQTEMDVNQKRLKDVNQFQKLGRSRMTDVLSVQSNIATLDLTRETIRTALDTSRSVYAFMTGLDKNTQLADQEKIPETIDPIATYVGKIDNRPDIKSALALVEAADKNITVAKGAHSPELDLGANYYLERPGYLSDVKWDVSLGLTFPIFQGGIIQSNVRIAASQLKQNEIALSKARRAAQEQVDSGHSQVLGDLAQLVKQRQANEIYEKSYQSEMRDYRYGLVTNLEVLVSLNTSQESARSYDRLLYQFKMDYLKLQALVADRPVLPVPATKDIYKEKG